MSSIDDAIDQTIEGLCVAQYAKSYCSACANGHGCCVPPNEEKMLPVVLMWSNLSEKINMLKSTKKVVLTEEKLLSVSSSKCKNSHENNSHECLNENKLTGIDESLKCYFLDLKEPKCYISFCNCQSYKKVNLLINDIERCFITIDSLAYKSLVHCETYNNYDPYITQYFSNCSYNIEKVLGAIDSIMKEVKSKYNFNRMRFIQPKIECLQNLIYEPSSTLDYCSDNDTKTEIFSNFINKGASNYISNESCRIDKKINELLKIYFTLAEIDQLNRIDTDSLLQTFFKIVNNLFDQHAKDIFPKTNNRKMRHRKNVDQNIDLSVFQPIFKLLINELTKTFEGKLENHIIHTLYLCLEEYTNKVIIENLHLKSSIDIKKENELKETVSIFNNIHSDAESINLNSSLVNENYNNSECLLEPLTYSPIYKASDVSYKESTMTELKNDHYTWEEVNKNKNDSVSCKETLHQNNFVSYTDTLALYEDNQELQKSLLSILHSLNDIHDEFLRRRRKEIASLNQSLNYIQNGIQDEINYSTNKQFVNDFDLNEFQVKYDETLSKEFEVACHSRHSMSDDTLESFQEIIRVSDELKNMSSYGPGDRHNTYSLENLHLSQPTNSTFFTKPMRQR